MKKAAWIAGLLWLLTIGFLYQISRSDFLSFWGVYAIAFAAYFWLLFVIKIKDLPSWLAMAFVARFISFYFEPQLSDDYFRFIWDGMVSEAGIHPMAYTPRYLEEHPELITSDSHLFSLLNSKDYYSVYPPVSQWIFRLSYWINGLNLQGNILFYKILLILVDALIIYLLHRLLKQKGSNEQQVLWYALNPMIILEFTGNLHMDGLMIAGLLGAVYLSQKQSSVWSSVAMITSIGSKMLTLMLIPFMPRNMYWKKIIPFGLISSGGAILLIFLSFGNHTGWIQSVTLWFRSFEFNASLYYIARMIGFWWKGYNIIGSLGPAMLGLTLIGIIVLWLSYLWNKRLDWSTAMLASMTLYFMMSTTVHPWYLGIILVLGILSHHLYPMVWTFLVALSYSHYDSGGSEENYWLIGTEYILLLAWIVFEWHYKRNQNLIDASFSHTPI